MNTKKIVIKNWESLNEMFTALNEKCDYLVMRNFEQMTGDDFLMDGHEDIDFLCADPDELITTLGAFPRKIFNKKVQTYILLKNKKVKVDIRCVGDNYYDKEWQVNMLKNKVMHENGFWVMNEQDYFYSLIYHAVLQKKSLSTEYSERLTAMGKELGLDVHGEGALISSLELMMHTQGYRFVHPKDSTVPNRFYLLSEKPAGRVAWLIRKLSVTPPYFVYKTEWSDIKTFFAYLNEFHDYIVLRNWEQLDNPSLFVEGHEDIDILCDNPRLLKKEIGAQKESILGHYDHYWITVDGEKIEIGIRYVGDGYYDICWEREMLKSKINYRELCKVMNDENYFYSLIYHSLFHKKNVSEDYMERLSNIGKKLGYSCASTENLETIILDYIQEHDYHIPYPKDITIPNGRMINNKIFEDYTEGEKRWKVHRIIAIPKRIVRKIGRKIIHR